MYLDDPREALRRLASHARPGGVVSFTVRNGDALAYRPSARAQWAAALQAFDSDGTYVNELGVSARAHRLSQAQSWCDELAMTVTSWYGVRIFTDTYPPDATIADVGDLLACLTAETKASRLDPYRHLGSQLHIVATTTADCSPVTT